MSERSQNYSTSEKNYTTPKRLCKVSKTYYYRRKINKKEYKISLKTKSMKVALYRLRLFNLMDEEEFVYNMEIGDYKYIFEYDDVEELKEQMQITMEAHKTILEVEAKFNKVNNVVDNQDELKSSGAITFQELELKYVAAKKKLGSVGKSTYKAYGTIFKKLKKRFEELPIEKLGFDDYDAFREDMIKSKLNPKTINVQFIYIKSFVQFAIDRNYIDIKNSLDGLEDLPEEN